MPYDYLGFHPIPSHPMNQPLRIIIIDPDECNETDEETEEAHLGWAYCGLDYHRTI